LLRGGFLPSAAPARTIQRYDATSLVPRKTEQVQPARNGKASDRTLHEMAHRVMKTRLPAGPVTAASAAEAMQGSCGELFVVLETAMGPAGLQALIGRAIQITARDYPWLTAVKPGTAADCPLSGLTEAAEKVGVDEAMEGYASLLASVVSLLIRFIGEDLTLRFVRHAWPKVSVSKLTEDVSE
jgi:hypothetical protein